MSHQTPLERHHEAYVKADASPGLMGYTAAQRPGAAVGQPLERQVQYINYGPREPAANESPAFSCRIVASFGDVEREYAAIRRGAGLFDCPHHGTLLIVGNAIERREFLNRMLTQELKDLAPGIAKSAFWLNRKGRIQADLLLAELGDRAFIDVDVHQSASTVKTLSEFLFAEDLSIRDASAEYHHIAVHGKLAPQVIAAACGFDDFNLEPSRAAMISIDGVEVVAVRRDQTGEPGFELIVSCQLAAAVWEFLLATDHIVGQDKHRVRPIGWFAFNIARIEAGTPLFNIDFGPSNLPHETGILHDRVSFTKGCYLGQEIVARMESLGKPKQMLVGLKILGDFLPVAGGQVFEQCADQSMGQQLGLVTSSALSPMLGATPIAFATVKSAYAQAGTSVLVNAEGAQVPAIVGPLRFWPAPLEVAHERIV